MSPAVAAPGTTVTIRGSGFTPGGLVDVGLAPSGGEYRVVARARSDQSGEVLAAVQVPSWVERGRSYVFVLTGAEAGARAFSGLLHVTTPEGRIRIEGRLTDEGVECPALRVPGTEALFTLVGDLDGVAPGEMVEVEGTLAEVSICMQGTTVNVERLRRR